MFHFCRSNPVQIPAINGGCPTGQYCRSLGNCSLDQCENNENCGGLNPVCESSRCVAKCPSTFEEPSIPTIENNITVSSLEELQIALGEVTDQFTKITLNGTAGPFELSSSLMINKPVMLVGQNNTVITCVAEQNANPLLYLGSNTGVNISDGVVIEGITFDRTTCSETGRVINLRARTDSINKIIIRNNIFVGGTDGEGAPISEGIVTGPGNNDWLIYGNSFTNLKNGLYVNVVEFNVTNDYNGIFWGNSLNGSYVGVQNSWSTQQLLFGNNTFELYNKSSHAFMLMQNVQKANFACNSISGSKDGAFVLWDYLPTARPASWTDVKLNYNNIHLSNNAGFKVLQRENTSVEYPGIYLSDGSLPASTDGTNNYWGAADGPGGIYGSGSGTPLLVDNLTYVPFLDSPFVLDE